MHTVGQRWVSTRRDYRWCLIDPDGQVAAICHSRTAAASYAQQLNAKAQKRSLTPLESVKDASVTRGETINETLLQRVREAQRQTG